MAVPSHGRHTASESSSQVVESPSRRRSPSAREGMTREQQTKILAGGGRGKLDGLDPPPKTFWMRCVPRAGCGGTGRPNHARNEKRRTRRGVLQLCVGRFLAGCERSRGAPVTQADLFDQPRRCDMRRRSKRRSSLGRRPAARREGEGKVGSAGPLPLVGGASSQPRKSWTWASNTGLWFGLAIPVAIAAALACSGAGGEFFCVSPFRLFAFAALHRAKLWRERCTPGSGWLAAELGSCLALAGSVRRYVSTIGDRVIKRRKQFSSVVTAVGG